MADPALKIQSFLAPGSIALDMRAPDKITLLRDLAQRASKLVPLSSTDIFAELSRREELGSTGIGGGVAIPHARFPGIEAPVALAARLKPPINFDAIDGLPVDLLFVLLVPSSASGDHLNALAAVSRKLRERSIVDQLRTIKDAEGFYRLLTE
ncbi:MAG: PTS sugar transporter subunit IIA [Hyphomicrobium sp.]